MAAASLKRCCLLFSSPISPFSVARFSPQIPHRDLSSLLLASKTKKNPSFPRKIYSSPRASCSQSSSCSGANGRTPAPDGTKSPAELFLHNTMTKEKELFLPKTPGRVGMYVCGVTTYDFSHIGHARVYVTFDVLYRYLKHINYEVLYVRNFTDVDDKIIARANELGEDPLRLSSRFCDEFHADMTDLQCLPPSVEPRVSDHINQIIDMIKQAFRYGLLPLFHFSMLQLVTGQPVVLQAIDGDVYFSVDKFPAYGRLSGRKSDDNRAGERVAVDSRKLNPADFALWKSAKVGEPYWESPWGPGRPGWHIECSAMSSTYLGHSFDIHGGGMDLVFPHHENEIAQSCAACGDSNIGYWVHNGFVTVNEEKMSKSLKNFFTIREVTELYHPLALRFFLMGTHYRAPMNYSAAQLDIASDRLFYIYRTLHDCDELLRQQNNLTDSLPQEILQCIQKLHIDFKNSMSDDLHTPIALASISEPLRIINELLHTKKGRKQELMMESLSALEKEVRSLLSVLGLAPSNFSEVLQQLRGKALKRVGITEEELLLKIDERNLARKNKLYERSDEIRKELAAIGITLMDSPSGTTWRPTLIQDIQVPASAT